MFLRIAAILGILAVVIGAFGAHGLKPRLSEYQLAIFEKGVSYHFIHTLAMLGVAILIKGQVEQIWLVRAAWCFLIGIICFSGSLYLLACRDLIPFSVAFAGPITPIGGLFFIVGWAMLLKVDF